MLPLTSIIKDEPFSILIIDNDLSSGKLLKPSCIKVNKIFTVEKRLIVMKIGTLNNEAFEKIKSELMKAF